MLDYFFTRFFHFYKKKGMNNYSVFSSSIFISILRLLLFYSIVMFLDVFSEGKISISKLHINHTGGSIVFLLFFIILINFDYTRYKMKHQQLIEKYKINRCNKWFKVWMIAALIIFLFCSPLLWMEIYKLF